ncbi:site-specific integrase [Lactococcus lactis]|uniref:Site-specific integrase n=1 Tax=Lactococcus lactis TaxID=1358 RepID=A0AAP3Z2Q5_9LACT|nr:site-specific integrase [Lactococcus lactis]MDG4977301.1 site-specific integrase [Lactococcus lactis]
MATFKQYTKKDGSTAWQYQTYLGIDEKTGKRKATTHRGFKTKKEAQINLNLYLADYERGMLAKSPQIKFTELYELFLESYKLQVKLSTLANTKRAVKNYILPKLGEYYVDQISVVQCQKIVNEWHSKYKSFKYLRAITSRVLKFAMHMELIKTNPMQNTLLPKKISTEKKDNFYDKEQLQNFFECVNDYLTRPIKTDMKMLTFFRILAFTGMRKSEVLALQWVDFNQFTNELTINKTVATDENYDVIIQTPKTENSNRIISLDVETAKILRVWRKQQMETMLMFGFNTNNPKQYILTNQKNTPLYPTQVNRWLVTILKNYDLPKITLHGFRHTHATLLLESGASIKEVQERLGHDNVSTTMNIYAHVIESRREESGNKFAKYVNF